MPVIKATFGCFDVGCGVWDVGCIISFCDYMLFNNYSDTIVIFTGPEFLAHLAFPATFLAFQESALLSGSILFLFLH